MTALNPLLAKVFRGPLDLNGPVLGRIFYLFEYARSYIEERSEGFDARFGTDTSAPVFERDQKTSAHFYVPTTASVIYENSQLHSDAAEQVRVRGHGIRQRSSFAYRIGIPICQNRWHRALG